MVWRINHKNLNSRIIGVYNTASAKTEEGWGAYTSILHIEARNGVIIISGLRLDQP
jgi:hypothetical protein